jgi:hypothetical protein
MGLGHGTGNGVSGGDGALLVGGAAAASRWRGEDSRFWDIVEVLGWVAHAGGAGVVAAHGFAVRGVWGGRVMMMIRAREEGGEGELCFASAGAPTLLALHRNPLAVQAWSSCVLVCVVGVLVRGVHKHVASQSES